MAHWRYRITVHTAADVLNMLPEPGRNLPVRIPMASAPRMMTPMLFAWQYGNISASGVRLRML